MYVVDTSELPVFNKVLLLSSMMKGIPYQDARTIVDTSELPFPTRV
jgi:hypothetical protein